jgi:Hydrazine synthase alpha subunit middle domain
MRKSVTYCVLVSWLAVGCQSGSQRVEVLPGVDSLVFAKRAFLEKSGEENVSGGSGRVVDYQRYTPGGGVFVLTPPTPDGTLRELTKQFSDVDIAGLDLSFDAKQVVFSMRHHDDDGHYHLYTAKVDGSEKAKQLTFAMADDVRPIYVPGDRVAFVTNQTYTPMGTRADEYNHGREATQIATISSLSGDADRKLCAQNLSHTADPFLLSDGTIGYSRWEHLGPTNDVKLFRMNPDCSNMLALAGQHGKDFNSLVQVREATPGVFIGIATAREGTIQAGAVMQIDAHMQADGVLNEEAASFTSLTPRVPTGRDAVVPSGVGRYRTPYLLGDGKYLVTWADGDVSDRSELANTAPQFGIYLYDPKTEGRVRVYDDPKFWDMYALPVRARNEPPVRASRLDVPANAEMDAFGGKAATLGSIDVTSTSLSETVSGGQFDKPVALSEALQQAEKVRIIEGFSSEVGSVREFGLTMHEGAAILAEVDVQKDKSWEAQVIPYLPYHLQAIDRFGLAIRSEGLWIQTMPGENRTCGGCHESRSTTASSTQGATLAQQLPDAKKDYSQLAVADRTELPWAGASSGNIQELFDAKCVSCHGGGSNDPFAGRTYKVTIPNEDDPTAEPLMYEIPYLLLSSAPVETYYEKATVTYPASYVSLLYPSAMMGDSMVEGDVPPLWVVPASARASKLIEKINATPSDDRANKEWAWKAPAHPEDVGVTLTPQERLMLIRMADLGGQYFTRRNIESSAMWQGSM